MAGVGRQKAVCNSRPVWGAICLKTQILKHLLNIDDIILLNIYDIY